MRAGPTQKELSREKKVKWRNHALDTPAVDKPAGVKMEAFVEWIGYELRPDPDRERPLEIADIAGRVRTHFKKSAPFTEQKVNKILDVTGIHCEIDEDPACQESTFTYNFVEGYWNITLPRGRPDQRSGEVFHEFWEILFWRCYHKIPWWREWVSKSRIATPHDKADEFAYQMLLPYQSVVHRARQLNYDLWAVSKFYQVRAGLAFRALTTATTFSYPCLHLWVVLDQPPPPPTPPPPSPQIDLFDASFFEATPQPVSVEMTYTELRKKCLRKPGREPELNEVAEWEAVQRLSALPTQGSLLEHGVDDLVYHACQLGNVMRTETDTVFGYPTGSPVGVVMRLAPWSSRHVYVQVVPAARAEWLVPDGYGHEEEGHG